MLVGISSDVALVLSRGRIVSIDLVHESLFPNSEIVSVAPVVERVPMTPLQYTRRPMHVDAVQVTTENMLEVADWCGGEIKAPNVADQNVGASMYILVDVPEARSQRQKEAYVGDWVLKFGPSGFKVYTNGAFHKSFTPKRDEVPNRRKSNGKGARGNRPTQTIVDESAAA